MPFDKLRDRDGGSGTAKRGAVFPSTGSGTAVGAQGPLSGARYALLGRAKRPKVDYDKLRDRGGGRGMPFDKLRDREECELRDRREGLSKGSGGGSVIWMFKMGEFLAGFVFYFYLCGDLS